MGKVNNSCEARQVTRLCAWAEAEVAKLEEKPPFSARKIREFMEHSWAHKNLNSHDLLLILQELADRQESILDMVICELFSEPANRTLIPCSDKRYGGK